MFNFYYITKILTLIGWLLDSTYINILIVYLYKYIKCLLIPQEI